MARALILIGLAVAGCGPLGGSTGIPPASSPVGVAGCPITAAVVSERPKNPNTASFGRGWYVSADRLLWASASGPFYVGENKVLWERPGSIVRVSGKLLDGDPKGAGAPTITGPEGYEGLDYQASGLTFPASGCWEVEARAESSVLDFVVYVYPR